MGNLFSEAKDYFHTTEVEILHRFMQGKIRNFEILMVAMYYINVYYNFKGKLRRHSKKKFLQTVVLPVTIQSNLFSEP